MSFGIDPASRGVQAVVWWGARAIFRGSRFPIDYVFDRQQTTPHDRRSLACNALWFWIEKYGKPELEKQLRALSITASDEIDVTVESHGFKLIANPRKSFGYLYVGAWPTGPVTAMPPEPSTLSAPSSPTQESPRARITLVNDEEFRGGRRYRR